MKLLSLLLFVISMHLSATTHSQTVTLKIEKQSLSQVLTAIKQQTGYHIIYNDRYVNPRTLVSVQAADRPLEEVLDKLLTPQSLTYYMRDNTLVIRPLDSHERVPRTGSSDLLQKMISGKVTDEKGMPLEGVTVSIKGTSALTTTDVQGAFNLQVEGDGHILVCSAVGLELQELRLDDETNVTVVMKGSVSDLDEVVVVGYGTQKKANLTGAVATVKMDDVLGNRPISNTAEALQGAIPGLQVTSNSGKPGTAPGLNVRGYTSINGGSPLVLVDNVPMGIHMINPRDIESVTVLKDAAASSIYGGRAAFGVILITTKQGGKNQPLRVEYSGNVVMSDPADLPLKVGTRQMVQALKDWGTTSHYSGQDIDVWLNYLDDYESNPSTYPDGYAVAENGQVYPLSYNNNLIDEFMGTGTEHLHNLALSGGGEKSSYRISMGYASEDGILATDKDSYRKYNINALIKTDIARNLTGSVNVQYAYDDQKTPHNIGQLFTRAIAIPSYAPTGMHTLEDGSQMPYYSPANIVRGEMPISNFGDLIRIFGKAVYTPIDGLKITGEYTFRKNSDNTRNPTSTNLYINNELFNQVPLNAISNYSRSHSSTNYHALNLYINYTKTLGKLHHIGILAGINQESRSTETFSVNRDDLMSLSVPSISTSTGVIGGNDGFQEFAVSGYFGRLNYDFDGRYLLEVNGRIDGSSRFAVGDRFGFFPSVSAGWVVSEEAFWKPLRSVVNQFKFRGSFGEIGNQAIADYYPSIPSLVPYSAGWLDLATNLRYLSLNAPQLVSAGFTWETVRSANVGLDVSLIGGRFNSSFDLFRRRTLNMLAKGAELPASLGAAAPLQNVADLESKGWEWEVLWKDRIRAFSYSLGFNLSDNRAFITRFDNAAGLLSQHYVGKEIGEIWGYTTQGYFTVDDFVEGTLNDNLTGGKLKEGIAGFRGVPQNPGDIRYVDQNSDGEIFSGNGTLTDPGDRSIIGNNRRRYQYGIHGTAAFKGFDLSFFIQGIGKRDMWIQNQLFWPYTTVFTTFYEHQMDYWTPDNPSGFYPRRYANAGNLAGNRRTQTKYLSNGAYMRIKNITLGYTVSDAWTSRLSLSLLRVFFTAENPYTFKHTPHGIDPEVAALGYGTGYPFLKKYSFGLNLTF